MGLVTMIYTWFGGFKAVVWTDVLQLSVYLAGGIGALFVAWHLAGGAGHSFALAAAEGKLRLVDPTISLTRTYTLLGGIVGGALLSAASHGTDHLIVQRLLATRSLRDARVALVGSGVMVIFQFSLFLLVGLAIWSAGLAPEGMASDQIFPRFVVEQLPVGLAGLVIAGILAAAMGTHSSAINSLASSATHDLYASYTGRTDPVHLLRVGRLFSAVVGHGTHLRRAVLPPRLPRQRHAGGGARALDRLDHLRPAARHLSPGRAVAESARTRRGRGRRRDGVRHVGRHLRQAIRRPARPRLARAGGPAGLALVRAARHLPRLRNRRAAQLSSGGRITGRSDPASRPGRHRGVTSAAGFTAYSISLTCLY